MTRSTLLEVCNVSFGYSSSSALILESVTFSVDPGEVVGVTGASGTGKSTLLRLVTSMLTPTQGVIKRPPLDPNPFAYSPQGDVLLEYRSVFENVALLLERGQPIARSVAELLQNIDPLLATLRLEPKRDDLPATLSGGMRQRVQFLQAIVTNAPLLLLDEPFAQQDRDNQHAMEKLLVATVRGSTSASILVSHDIDALAAVCDRTLFLGGTPASLCAIVETPESLRSLAAEERRAHPGFVAHNNALWAERARGALL